MSRYRRRGPRAPPGSIPRSAARKAEPSSATSSSIGVAFIAPALAAKVAVKAVGVARPVGHLMRQGGVIALGIAEGLKGRHLHIVGRHGVISLIATMPDIGGSRGKELLRMVDALDGVKLRLGNGIEMRRQALDLLDVEDGVAFHEREYPAPPPCRCRSQPRCA